jgi:transcription initiation factor IIE alpha subunit
MNNEHDGLAVPRPVLDTNADVRRIISYLRVQRLIGRGRTKHEAEEIVEFVIRTKEGLTKSELRSSVEP